MRQVVKSVEVIFWAIIENNTGLLAIGQRFKCRVENLSEKRAILPTGISAKFQHFSDRLF